MKKTLLISVLCFGIIITGCSSGQSVPETDDTNNVEPSVSSVDNEEDTSEEIEEIDYTVEYEVRDGKAYVTGLSGDGNHATIDSDYDGSDVVGIDASAFEGSNLHSLLIWADLEEIGDSAFKDCSDLVEISIPSATTYIGSHAFENCTSLKTVLMWAEPNEIAEATFKNCTALEDISIPSSVTVIGNNAFENCTNMKTALMWGDSDIGEYAFAGCAALTDISIGSDVKKVCDHAFDGCSSLESVIVWGDSTEIGKDAFANCPKLEDKPSETGGSVQLDPSQTSSGSETADTSKSSESENNDANESSSNNGIRPEFQEAMDEYLAFFEEYCEFMETYSSSDNPAKLLKQYNEYNKQYVETMEAFEELGEEDLSDEEEDLYLETQLEVNDMLANAL